MEKKHKVSKATGFHLKLREGTQALHDEAESGNFQIRMVNGELAKKEFSNFLCQMKHVHATLDVLLQDAASKDDRVNHMFDESHKRLHRIEQDLDFLNISSSPAVINIPSISFNRFQFKLSFEEGANLSPTMVIDLSPDLSTKLNPFLVEEFLQATCK